MMLDVEENERGDSALIGPDAVFMFFDDRRDQVEPLMERIQRHTYEVRYVDDVAMAAEELRILPAGSQVFLDQHVPNVFDLGAAGDEFASMKTERGTSVGLTMAVGMIPVLRPENDIDVYVISQRELDENADETLQRGLDRHQIRGFFRKDNIVGFENYLERSRLERDPALQEMKVAAGGPDAEPNAGSKFDQEDYIRRFYAAEKMLREWSNDDMNAVAAVFGFPKDAGDTWTDLRKYATETYQSDVLLRANAVIGIKRALVMIYRSPKEIEREIAYLNDPDEFLDGATPWELMASGDMGGLVRVATMFGQLN